MNEYDNKLKAFAGVLQKQDAMLLGQLVCLDAEIEALTESLMPILTDHHKLSSSQMLRKIENRRREIEAKILAEYERSQPGLAALMDNRHPDQILPEDDK